MLIFEGARVQFVYLCEVEQGRRHLKNISVISHNNIYIINLKMTSVVVYKRQSNIDIIPEDDYYTEMSRREGVFNFFDLPVSKFLEVFHHVIRDLKYTSRATGLYILGLLYCIYVLIC